MPRLTAAFTPGGRQCSTSRRGARRRLTGTVVEPAGRIEGRSAAPTAAAPTAASTKPKALRQSLEIPGEQRGLDRLELLRVGPCFGERVEHDVDARDEPRAVPLLRRRERDGRRCLALEVPDDPMQTGAGWALYGAYRVAAHVADHDLRPRPTVGAAARETLHHLGAVLRARCAEGLLSGTASAQRRLAVLVRRRRLEQIRAGRNRAVIDLLDRRDVDDPQRAPDRRAHRGPVARMNAQSVHR